MICMLHFVSTDKTGSGHTSSNMDPEGIDPGTNLRPCCFSIACSAVEARKKVSADSRPCANHQDMLVLDAVAECQQHLFEHIPVCMPCSCRYCCTIDLANTSGSDMGSDIWTDLYSQQCSSRLSRALAQAGYKLFIASQPSRSGQHNSSLIRCGCRAKHCHESS